MHTRTSAHSRRPRPSVLSALLLVLCLSAAAPSLAQQSAGNDPELQRAVQLYETGNFVEAVPLLEKLSKKYPDAVEVHARLGYALYASTASIKDAPARQAARERALAALRRAQQLGDRSNLSQMAIEVLSSADDAANIPFSNVREAERAMREGEEAFVRGDYERALERYGRALNLDPRLYYAALFSGDVHYKLGLQEKDAARRTALLDKAGEWFARAVSINENIETAHRYWGDALMNGADRRDESLRKFVEAFVAEPYNRNARMGLVQWGGRYGVRLAHPPIEPPTSVKRDGDKKVTIDIDPKLLAGGKDDGTSAWMMYGISRALWQTEKFAKQFPAEKTYRHTLAEEADALRMVVVSLREQSRDKPLKLDPALAALVELHDKGLIEPFVLLARPDEGIAQDYAEYRRTNRDKLRRYLLEYVAAGKQWPGSK